MSKKNILDEIREGNCPDNKAIYESMLLANDKLSRYKHIFVSISGGADSDILLDIIEKARVGKDVEVNYVYFNTGMEYESTHKHLKYLENKYGIEIERIRPKEPVPLACKKRGVPFWSKQVSLYLKRLQRHGFKWEDESYEVLLKKYCKRATPEMEEEFEKELELSIKENRSAKTKRYSKTEFGWYKGCVSSLKFWCNQYTDHSKETISKFDIAYIPYLKEFIMENNPDFEISDECCIYAKKSIIKEYLKKKLPDLSVSGVRKSEGGVRSTAYKNCFTSKSDGVDEYRPIFWYDEKDKEEYECFFNIVHSDCYLVYGLKRTGCAGCPFAKGFEDELEIIKKYEPKLYKAAVNVFGKSYEYTRKYIKFRENKKKERDESNC